jgi:hypothetical protein
LISTKILFAYKALTGDTFGRKKAELLVVYDSSGKKCYVVEMADLIKGIIERIKHTPSVVDEYFINKIDSIFAKPLINDF